MYLYLKLVVLVSAIFITNAIFPNSKNMTSSIIIPCDYKHVIYLEKLLEYYENQTVLPNEIVISISRVNKAYKKLIDNLKNINWSFSVKYLLSKNRLYAGENRNKACQVATGDIFICQDADDLPAANRVEIIKYFFENYNVDHIIHLYNFNENSKLTNPQDIDFIYPKNYNPYAYYSHNGNIAIKKRVFDIIQWTNRPKGQDVEFNKKVYNNKNFKCILLLEPLVTYRVQYSSWKNKLLHTLKA